MGEAVNRPTLVMGSGDGDIISRTPYGFIGLSSLAQRLPPPIGTRLYAHSSHAQALRLEARESRRRLATSFTHISDDFILPRSAVTTACPCSRPSSRLQYAAVRRNSSPKVLFTERPATYEDAGFFLHKNWDVLAQTHTTNQPIVLYALTATLPAERVRAAVPHGPLAPSNSSPTRVCDALRWPIARASRCRDGTVPVPCHGYSRTQPVARY